jgi:5-methylcytosine-specific restriction enzyme subunit McrC
LQYKVLPYQEHYNGVIELPESLILTKERYGFLFPKRKNNLYCFSISKQDDDAYHLEAGYFIGIDWIEQQKVAIYIAPKLNTKVLEQDNPSTEIKETNYLKMLFNCLKHGDVVKKVDELFLVKWDKPEIIIEQKQDLLTPLLIIEFLSIVKTIVRKGLKRSYYKVEENLYGRVKGKVQIAKTLKQNIFQNKNLHTYCSFEEFGLNNLENRLLKKALVFIRRYMATYSDFGKEDFVQDLFNYIHPAFDKVSSKIDLKEIKNTKTNAFYKEYEKAIKLARVILRRYGYNISNIEKQEVSVPPFWIDMSKLFELYVLGLLKDRFQNQVQYHFTTHGNELDYILKSEKYKLVIDAKYKPSYALKKLGNNHSDVRQVSGYARLEKVYKHLEKKYPESINCLIIYPNQENGLEDLKDAKLLEKHISGYFGIYKLGIKLPTL